MKVRKFSAISFLVALSSTIFFSCSSDLLIKDRFMNRSFRFFAQSNANVSNLDISVDDSFQRSLQKFRKDFLRSGVRLLNSFDTLVVPRAIDTLSLAGVIVPEKTFIEKLDKIIEHDTVAAHISRGLQESMVQFFRGKIFAVDSTQTDYTIQSKLISVTLLSDETHLLFRYAFDVSIIDNANGNALWSNEIEEKVRAIAHVDLPAMSNADLRYAIQRSAYQAGKMSGMVFNKEVALRSR